jgi:hypothetical protein
MYTLMHISDLHRSEGDPIFNDELLSGIVSDQARYSAENPAISTPDAIIVSGDLVQGLPLGSSNYPDDLKKQYEEALELLIKFSDTFTGGDRSKVIIVPGNHDIDWNKAFSSMEPVGPDGKDLPRLLSNPNSGYRWCWKTRQLYKITNYKSYEDRISYFSEMYERFYSGVSLSYPLDSKRYWNLFELDKGRITVCAFNSCANNDCFNYYGEIPFEAIAQSHLELIPHLSQHTLKIAVWHHSIQGRPQQPDYMDSDTIKVMIDKGFRVGLHGHHHKSDAAPFSLFTSDQQTMALLSAGSLCAGSKELPSGFNRQYNIIEISDDYLHARIHVREMQLRGVFSAGRLVALGGRSYDDLEWTSALPSYLVNTGRGGGGVVAQVELIERLISEGSYDEAVTNIKASEDSLEHYGRQLLVKALFQAERWEDLILLLSNPENDDELAIFIRAVIALKRWTEGEEVLSVIGKTGLFSEATVRELSTRLNVERRISG